MIMNLDAENDKWNVQRNDRKRKKKKKTVDEKKDGNVDVDVDGDDCFMAMMECWNAGRINRVD